MSRRPHQQAPPQNSQEESMALRVNAIRRYLYRVNSRYQKVAPPRRDFMVFHGISWYFLVCSWHFMVFHGISFYFMVFLGISWYFMVFLGISWYFLVFLGISWYFLVFHGISWYFLVCSWYFMVFLYHFPIASNLFVTFFSTSAWQCCVICAELPKSVVFMPCRWGSYVMGLG